MLQPNVLVQHVAPIPQNTHLKRCGWSTELNRLHSRTHTLMHIHLPSHCMPISIKAVSLGVPLLHQRESGINSTHISTKWLLSSNPSHVPWHTWTTCEGFPVKTPSSHPAVLKWKIPRRDCVGNMTQYELRASISTQRRTHKLTPAQPKFHSGTTVHTAVHVHICFIWNSRCGPFYPDCTSRARVIWWHNINITINDL